ncbi:hypothetical protein GGX14DRAFT_555821 [Mycena pura]|uniref:Uncharacterized protein n=1 Tax=Mycena pura TaxID=153505 RepID=A0AAD6YRL6_9AGAR|nr:hypothetical protein GGX14DRAFT_555821 [Mycena pura]
MPITRAITPTPTHALRSPCQRRTRVRPEWLQPSVTTSVIGRRLHDVRGRNLIGEGSAQLCTRPDWTMHEKQPAAVCQVRRLGADDRAAGRRVYRCERAGVRVAALPVALSGGYSTDVHCTLTRTSPSLARAFNDRAPSTSPCALALPTSLLTRVLLPPDLMPLSLSHSTRASAFSVPSDADDDGDDEPDKQKKPGGHARAHFGVFCSCTIAIPDPHYIQLHTAHLALHRIAFTPPFWRLKADGPQWEIPGACCNQLCKRLEFDDVFPLKMPEDIHGPEPTDGSGSEGGRIDVDDNEDDEDYAPAHANA